jgi:hypothetical protein
MTIEHSTVIAVLFRHRARRTMGEGRMDEEGLYTVSWSKNGRDPWHEMDREFSKARAIRAAREFGQNNSVWTRINSLEEQAQDGTHLTDRQELALVMLHARYNVKKWSRRDFWHTFDLPEGYVAGWVTREDGERLIYVGVSPDGQISS